MKKTKQGKGFFDSYLRKVYEVCDMLEAEGHSRAECRYKEIMAAILLFVREDLQAIRNGVFFLVGLFLGFLLMRLI